MPYLVDTNILVRQVRTDDAEHLLTGEAIRKLVGRGDDLFYTQQSRREFWNTCTRPAESNGLGMSVAATVAALAAADLVFTRLPDLGGAGFEWDRLVTRYMVIGRAVHDAQLVASMLAHGLTHILTYNTTDFRRYEREIKVIHPRDV